MKKLFLAALTLFAAQTNYADAQAEARELIIILDIDQEETSAPEPEKRMPPMLACLVLALIQKTAPIVVTPSLWNNFIERKKRFGVSPYLKNFRKKPAQTLDAIYSKPAQDFICYATPFNSNEWVMKEIKNVAYILIPKAYLAKKMSQKVVIPMAGKNDTLFKCFGKNDTTMPGNLTRQELMLGLKIDHYPNIVNPLATKSPSKQEQINAIDDFDWIQLFVTKKDLGLVAPTSGMIQAQNQTITSKQYRDDLLAKYKQISGDQQATIDVFEQYMWPWYIYLTGHGASQEDELIANLTIEQFRRFILSGNFLLNMKCLLIFSCYAGGQHTDPALEESYKDIKKIFENNQKKVVTIFRKIPYNLNYTVITSALTDQPTWGMHFSYELRKNPQPNDIVIPFDTIPLVVDTNSDFNLFFTEIKKYFSGTPDKKTVASIINNLHAFKDDPFLLTSTPLIRFPHTEWTKVIDLDNELNSIDRKTVLQYIQEKKDFVVDKKALLLYESYIPMPLIFKYKFDPKYASNAGEQEVIDVSSIVPMNTKATSYFFTKITKTESDLLRVFKSFTPFEEEPYPKTFYIKELITQFGNRGLMGELGKPEYNNKNITLQNVVIKQESEKERMKITITFSFANNKKQQFYYQATLDDYYKNFNKKLAPLANNAAIDAYKNKFAAEESSAPQSYTQLQQTTKKMENLLQQEKQNPGFQPAPNLKPIISERKLIRSLNDLAESLGQLKKMF